MLTINPDCKISFENIPNGFQEPPDKKNLCIIVDDFLLHPELPYEYAVAKAAEFHSPIKGFYPGTLLELPNDVLDSLTPFLDEIFRKNYDLGEKKMSQFVLRYSLLTTKPEDLNHFQTICHRDIGPQINLTVNKCFAGVLYLFKDANLGGTGFYTKKNKLLPKQMKPIVPAKYLAESNENFELRKHLPAKWNRLVLYPSHVLHSAYIDHPELISNNPADGRLTLNNFTWFSDPDSALFKQ